MPLARQATSDLARTAYVPPTPAGPDESTARLDSVETHSNGTLPTSMSLALAESQINADELRRASMVVARHLDVPANWFFPGFGVNPSAYTDPTTGGPLTLDTARRLIQPYEAKAVSGVLSSMQHPADPNQLKLPPRLARLEGPQGTPAPVSPAAIASYVKAMAPLEGDSISFTQALGAAGLMASEGVDPQVLQANVKVASQIQGLTDLERLSLAHVAASSGVRFSNRFEALKMAFPDVASLIDQAQGLKTQEAVAAGAPGAGQPSLVQPGASPFAALPNPMQAGMTLAKNISDNTGDYFHVAQQMESQIKLTDEHWQNSPAMIVWNNVNKYLVKPLNGVLDDGLYLVLHGLEPPTQKRMHQSIEANLRETGHQLGLLYSQRETAGEVIAREMHLPSWSAPVIEIAGSWYLGPDIIAAKMFRGVQEARLFSRAGGAETWGSRVTKFLDSPMKSVGKWKDTRPAEFLQQAAHDAVTKGLDGEAMYERAVDTFRSTYLSEGIHPDTAARIFDYVEAASRAGVTATEQAKDVRGILASALGFRAPKGSLAERIGNLRDQQVAAEGSELPPNIISGETPAAAFDATTRETNQALGWLEDWDAYTGAHLGDASVPLQMEIPHLRNPISRLGLAMRSSPLADTDMGRFVREYIQLSPERAGVGKLRINFEERPAADLRRVLTRYRTLSRDELAQAQREMKAANSVDNPAREIATRQIVQNWADTALRRMADEFNLTEKDMQAIMTRADKAGNFQPQAFGVTTRMEEGAAGLQPVPDLITSPILETQAENFMAIADPAWIRKGIKESLGTLQIAQQAFYRAHLGAIPPAVRHTFTLNKVRNDAIDFFIRDLFLSWWKPAQVIKPAYVLRVVGIDEGTRFVATAGVLGRIESSRSGAWLLNKFSKEDTVSMTVYDEITGHEVTKQITLHRPGSSYFKDYELANNSDQLALLGYGDSANLWQFTKKRVEGWGAIMRGEPGFHDRWLHDLTKQYSRSVIGQQYLGWIEQGVGHDQMVEHGVSFLSARRGLAGRIMGGTRWTEDSLRAKVEQGVENAESLTGRDPWLARKALNDTLTLKQLQQWSSDKSVVAGMRGEPNPVPHFVHGPLMATSSDIDNLLKATARSYVNLILKQPTNKLTRQPYFRFWYSEMKNALLKGAAGKVVSTEFADRVESASREFALTQVKRIMFDYTRNARFGEAVDFAMPFFQPFAETFQVYGRILRQNPALIGRVVRLHSLAKQTGFIRTDPQTGQEVIPMSWWMGGVPMLTMTGLLPHANVHGSGFAISLPLTSLNMFIQSAFPVPVGGINIPVPTPGFSPPVQLALQQWVSHEGPIGFGDASVHLLTGAAKARFSSWLYQYGPVTPISAVPTYLRRLLEGIPGFKGWQDSEQNSVRDHFLQLYAAMGIKGTRAQLIARANTDASQFSIARGVMTMFGFGAPKFTFPTQALEDEWHGLQSKYHDQPGKAFELWMKKYPNLSLLTIPKYVNSTDRNAPPVTIPSTEEVAKLLDTPSAKAFAKEHPNWVWAIIPQEFRDGKFDPGVLFAQVQAGTLHVQTPAEFLSADDVRKGWDAWQATNDAWTAQQEKFRQEGLTEGDATWKGAAADHAKEVAEIGRWYPDWNVEFHTIDTQGISPNVLGEARGLAADPTFQKTEVGHWLRGYLLLRDQIFKEMRAQNITNLDTKGADEAGLAKRYADGVAALTKLFPQGGIAYNVFFGADLRGVKGAGLIAYDRFSPEVRHGIESFEADNDAIKAEIRQTGGTDQQQQYLALRNHVESAYTDYPASQNPLVVRWNMKNPGERQQDLVYLTGKPYIFASRFDRQTLLGESTTPQAEATWSSIDAANIAISSKQQTDPNFSATNAHKALDAWVAAKATADPVFRGQLAHANEWGYMASKTVPQIFGKDNKTSAYWEAVSVDAKVYQGLVEATGLHGEHDFNPKAKVAYALVRAHFASYIKELRAASPQFDHQWAYLEDKNGTSSLLDAYFPPTWYRLGGVVGG